MMSSSCSRRSRAFCAARSLLMPRGRPRRSPCGSGRAGSRARSGRAAPCTGRTRCPRSPAGGGRRRPGRGPGRARTGWPARRSRRAAGCAALAGARAGHRRGDALGDGRHVVWAGEVGAAVVRDEPGRAERDQVARGVEHLGGQAVGRVQVADRVGEHGGGPGVAGELGQPGGAERRLVVQVVDDLDDGVGGPGAASGPGRAWPGRGGGRRPPGRRRSPGRAARPGRPRAPR